jgi:hypothetical protein
LTTTRLHAGAAVAAVALVLVGCSSIGSDEQTPTERVEQPRYLRQAVVERQPTGSPGRAFLEWWRALQFDNPVAVSVHYASELGLTPAKVEAQLAYGPGAFSFSSTPKIVETVREGNRATVNVLMTRILRAPNGRVDKVRTARGFNFVREGGEWRLSENLYLERLVRQAKAIEKLLRNAPKQGQSGGAGTGDG